MLDVVVVDGAGVWDAGALEEAAPEEAAPSAFASCWPKHKSASVLLPVTKPWYYLPAQ